jgi:hypothetical protein
MTRHCAWRMAGVVLPLVLGGLILMHTVDLDPAAEVAGDEHGEVASTSAGIDLHGEHEDCDGCHVGLRVTAACVAVLGSIAVWRITHRPPTGTTLALVASPDTSRWPAPPPARPCGRPPWVQWGVMLC